MSEIELVIVGAGGHGRQFLDVIDAHNAVGRPRLRLLGFLDDDPVTTDLLARQGTELLGPTALLPDLGCRFVIAIASPKDRRRIDATATTEPISVRHPTASVGSLVVEGSGLLLSAGAVIDTNVVLGRHCHVNWGASVGHESRIGDYVTITPGVRISGNVTVGDDVFFGTNATVVPGITIGEGAVIGAGAVVRHDVPAGTVFTGR